MRSRWAFLSVFVMACGGAGASAPRHDFKVPSRFPSKDAVEKLARAPATPIPLREVASPPEWRVEPAPESAPIETRFNGLTFAKELRCIAREYGRVRSEQGLEPDERLTRFIVSACGLVSNDVATMYWKTTAPADQSDESIIAALQGLSLPPQLKGKPAGVWLTRKGNQVMVTLAAGRPDDTITATLADPSGRISVSGSALDVDQVVVLVNRGNDGVAACPADPSASLPSFSFTCTLAEGDAWAWIEVVTRTSGRLLLNSRARLIGRRDLTSALEFRRRPLSELAGEPTQILLEGVNRTRTNAGLTPLTFAPAQSATNARLVPHFFGAEFNHQGAVSDQIALGLMAGWDIGGGVIRDGRFYSLLLTGAKTPGDWLDYALEQPFGRYTLLTSDAHQIAIGAAPRETLGGQGALVTAYSFFGAEDPAVNEHRVLKLLARVRGSRNMPPPAILPALPSLAQQAALIHAGQSDPQDALQLALTNDSQDLGRPLRGWLVATSDLDRVAFPNELLQPGSIALRAVVTTYRPEGSPWGMYLVLLAALAPSPQQLAMAKAKRTAWASSPR
jgi:hypothetical protein